MSAPHRPDATSPIAMRSPDEVGNLACMGAAYQHRLSFMRILLRRMKRDNWAFARSVWQIDAEGYGTAVYTAKGPARTYSLVAFSTYLDPEKRSDRVIATAWDASFALFDGIPTTADVNRLRQNVPLQEAGRVTSKELSVSRANRSVRLYDHVVARLSQGLQPEAALLEEVGYLMRTTAVYGSGKLGASDYDAICDREELKAPFQVEMLSVYLTREFTLDLVEHVAEAKAPGKAAKLTRENRRKFGVGNSTGLGLAPYLVNHPMLLNAWFTVREAALQRVRQCNHATVAQAQKFCSLIARAKAGLPAWRTCDATQKARLVRLEADLIKTSARFGERELMEPQPWDAIYRWAEAELSLEGRELVVSLLIECNPESVDDLEARYVANETAAFRINGARSVGEVVALLKRNYAWTRQFDFADPKQLARFWYTSIEKLEPRLGERAQEAGSEREQPIAVARDVQALWASIEAWPEHERLAAFLLAHPEFRSVVRRVMMSETAPYLEIRDNIIGANMRPIDILRFKLAFFGATRFDPRSDLWVRITMFQHAPCMRELADADVDDWFLPSMGEA